MFPPLCQRIKIQLRENESVRAKFDWGFDFIGFILKGLLSDCLQGKSTYKYIRQLIVCERTLDSLAIFENNFLVSLHDNVSGPRSRLYIKSTVAREGVRVIRAIKDPMRAWWMVWSLLKIDSCAILTGYCESFTKDWIQRLCHIKIIILLSYSLCDEQLHALERVIYWSSIIQINWHATMLPALHL